jgi:hypothetical protein
MAQWGANVIGGAGTGAAMGSVGGPYGALAGGALGALAGVFTSIEQENDEKRKQDALDYAKKEFNLTQDEVEELLSMYYENPDNFLGTREDVDAYKKAVQGYNPNDYVYDFDEFEYKDENGNDITVDDFVNPYYDKIIKQTSDKVQHSAAGAGIGRGTGAANAIADAVTRKNDELYKTALNEYNTDRSQKYTEWAGNIEKMQQRLNQLKAATDTEMTMKGNLAQDYLTTQQQQFADQIAAKQNRSQGNLQLTSAGLMI